MCELPDNLRPDSSSALQFQPDIPAFIDLQGHMLDMPLKELLSLRGRHFDPSISQSGIKHIIDIQVDGAVDPVVHLLKQRLLLNVFTVAGIEIIQIAVENTGVCEGSLHVRPALLMLDHHKEIGIWQR